MNQESEENFEQLRRMLALKRHEQPPPGYFDRFPREVLSRIRAGEKGEVASGGFGQWFWSLLEAKPAFAGAFGVAVCAVLVSGILNSEEAGLVSANDSNPIVLANPFDDPPDTVAVNVIHGSGSEMTNGAPSLSALFDNYPSIHPQPAMFQLLEPDSAFLR